MLACTQRQENCKVTPVLIDTQAHVHTNSLIRYQISHLSSFSCRTFSHFVCVSFRSLDLVNVHLFHDASNLVACNSSPSVYSNNRKNALRYVVNRWEQTWLSKSRLAEFKLSVFYVFIYQLLYVLVCLNPGFLAFNPLLVFFKYKFEINSEQNKNAWQVCFPSRISDNRYTAMPFFLFGDFNFRLDTLSLVQVCYNTHFPQSWSYI